MDDQIGIRPVRPEDAEMLHAIRLRPSVLAGTLRCPRTGWPTSAPGWSRLARTNIRSSPRRAATRSA